MSGQRARVWSVSGSSSWKRLGCRSPRLRSKRAVGRWAVTHLGAAPGSRPRPVCFGHAMVPRAKSSGPNPVHYVLGQTLSGRHLLCVVIPFPDGKGFPVTARPMDDSRREETIHPMEKVMRSQRIPDTDSIEELSRFWDTHGLADFADQLEEVRPPVFVSGLESRQGGGRLDASRRRRRTPGGRDGDSARNRLPNMACGRRRRSCPGRAATVP